MELIRYKNDWKLTHKGIERWPLSLLFKIINLDIRKYKKNKRKYENIWQDNYDDLEYIYYDAKKAYLESVKKEHPDKNGFLNRNTNIKEINIAWKRIKKIFAQHGIINGTKTKPFFKKKYEEHIQEIINLYNNNYTLKRIGELFNIDRHQIPIILAESLVPIRRRKLKNALVK